MADNLTQKEKDFLAQLRKSLTSEDSKQQAIYDAMYSAVETQLTTSEGESTAKDVFTAMQSAIDAYKTNTLDPIVAKNIADAKKVGDDLSKPQGRTALTKDIAIGGRDALTELVNTLGAAVTQDKAQDILNAAIDAGLDKGGEEFALDAAYHATLVTNIHHDQQVSRVDGHGTEQTVRRPDQGKIRKGGEFKHEGNIKGGSSRFVVRGDLFKDDKLDYDTLDQIAEAWIAKHNTKAGFTLPALDYHLEGKGPIVHDDAVTLKPAGSGADNYRTNIDLVTRWMAHANELQNKKGSYCDKTTFKGFVIHPGDELATPEGDKIAPKQTSYVCTTCTVNNAPTPESLDLGGVVAAAPKKPNTPPPEKKPEPTTPHYYARMDTPASDGKTYHVGSMDWTLNVVARSGVFEQFTDDYYSLKNITPRLRVKTAGKSGVGGENSGGENTGEYLDEGKYAFWKENGNSRQDNGVDKRHGTTGKSINSMNSPRGRDYMPGFLEKVEANGDLVRTDDEKIMAVHGGDYSMMTFRQFTHLGKMGGIPVGFGIGRPSHQEPLEAETRRWGLSQVNVAMAEVNKGGFHNMFADQKTVLSSPFESPDRLIASAMLRNAQNHFVDEMRKVDDAKTPEEKQESAKKALVAYRDFGDNFLVKGTDAMRMPYEQSSAAIRSYLTKQGVDVAKIDATLATEPRLHLVDMPKEQMEKLQNFDERKLKDGYRYGTLKAGETNAALLAAEKIAYPIMNSVELAIAKGDFAKFEESKMIDVSKTTWDGINYKADGTVNTDAIKTFGAFVEKGGNPAIQMGQLARDVWDNYEKYGLKKDDAHKKIEAFFSDSKDGKKALDDIKVPGNTSPIPFVGDQRLPIAHPELIGPEMGKAIQEHPEQFAELMRIVTNPQNGKSDGRRFGTALLRTIGAERPTTGNDGDDAPTLKALVATMPNDDAKAALRTAVVSATAYAEEGASGRSLKGAVTLDNAYTAAQNNHDTDVNQIYRNLFTTNTARDADADRVAVEGLKSHPVLAREAILTTILRDPNALKAVEADLRQQMKSGNNHLHEYDTLLDVMKDVRKASEDYKKSGNDKDMTKAVEKFGRFFTKLESSAQSTKDKTQNNGEQRFTAWCGLLDAVGASDEMSAAVVETMGRDKAMRNAFIKSVPQAVFADSMRHTNTSAQDIPEIVKDELYQPKLFTLPTDKKTGKVQANNGFLNLNRRDVTVNLGAINSVIAGNTEEPLAPDQDPKLAGLTPDQREKALKAADAIKKLGAVEGDVLNTNPRYLLGKDNEKDEVIVGNVAGLIKENMAGNKLFTDKEKAAMTDADFRDYAIQMVNGGYVNFSKDGSELVFTRVPEGVNQTFGTAPFQNQGHGLDRRLLVLPFIQQTEIIHVPLPCDCQVIPPVTGPGQVFTGGRGG